MALLTKRTRNERLASSCDILVRSLERRLAEIDNAMQMLAVQVAEADERREVIRQLLAAVKSEEG